MSSRRGHFDGPPGVDLALNVTEIYPVLTGCGQHFRHAHAGGGELACDVNEVEDFRGERSP